MKKKVNILLIGLTTLFLSFNVALSYAETSFDRTKMRPELSQSKVKTIKKGSVFVGNMESPRQIAVYGTPAWLFKTVSICFLDGKMCGMTCSVSAYSIDMYTGGLGKVLYSDTSEATQGSYCVKDGRVYVWDSGVAEPKDESGYSLVFSIEEECLTLIKTQIETINSKKLVYMADFYKMKKMSDEQLYQIEVVAYTKLLLDKETNQKVGKQKLTEKEITKKQLEAGRKILERKKAEKQLENDPVAQMEARQNKLKEDYIWCRFLFATEQDYFSCIIQDSLRVAENNIKTLLDQKFDIITNSVVDGKELHNEKNNSRTDLLNICYLCQEMRFSTIARYAESKLKDFIAERETLNNAYNKAKTKDPYLKCSEFLISYMNDD